MTIIDEPALETPDRGTPPVLGEATAHVTIDGIAGDGAGRHLGDAGRLAGRGHRAEAVRHRLAQGVRVVPALPRRDRGGEGHPGVVHHPVHRRHGRVDPHRAGAAAAPRRDGALPLRPPQRLRRVRARVVRDAAARPRRRAGRGALRAGWRVAPGRDARRVEPLLRLRPGRLHRLLAVRAGLLRDPGHLRAHRVGARLRLADHPGQHRLPQLGVRLVRRLRAGLPHRRPHREVGRRRSGCRPARWSRPAPTAGSGCSFKAEVQGSGDATRVVRMVPWKDGGANEGHSCVKGRFAYGYASHRDRQMAPMVRDSIDDEWQVVSWEEAIERIATGFLGLREKYGVGAIGGISSSRCTNEEVYVVQKMVRAAFGNNNIDTCARVCHSPTGYGLNHAFGTSAGTQDFASVEQADVMLVIGANPTDAHPVFASRMKRRMRAGAQVIVADPRRIDLVRSPHVEAAFHLPVRPGTNVAFVNAMCHVIVTEGLWDEEFVRARCEDADSYLEFIARPEHSPEATESETGIPASDLRSAARLYAAGPELGDLLRPRRHRAQPGLDDGHGHGQPRDAHRQPRARGRRGEPAARPEQRAGLVRHGVVPARAARVPARVAARGARDLRVAVGRDDPGRAGAAHPEHVRRRDRRVVQGPVRAGRGHRAERPQHPARRGGAALDGARRRARPVPQRDRAVRPRLPAGGVVPREGRHVHQRRAADQPGAPGHAVAGRARTSGRSSARSPPRWATRCRTRRRRRSWTRSPPRHRRSPGCRSTGSTPRARCSGRSPRPPRTARRRCTSGRSCAGWAS